MTRYSVTAWCDRLFTARCEVEAESPEDALTKARDAINDAPAEECDGGYPWDEWRVDTADADAVHMQIDEAVRIRAAARKLLVALKAASDWIDGPLFEQRAAIRAAIRLVIAEAEGRAS